MLSIKTSKSYSNKWNDDIEIIVYANEACRHYDKTEYLNLSGSKRKLLLSLLGQSVISDEAAFIITNIVNICKIEILKQASEAIITSDNDDYVEISGISSSFIETIKRL